MDADSTLLESMPAEIRETLRLITELNDTLTTLDKLVGGRHTPPLPPVLCHARRCYDDVVSLSLRLKVLADERQQLEARISALKTQLVLSGEDIPIS
jgi:hypothetical protein